MAGKGSLRYKDARKLLDQLLGEDRNGDTALVSRQPYSDPMFCRFFLCGLCPYALFTNTASAARVLSLAALATHPPRPARRAAPRLRTARADCRKTIWASAS